MTLKISDCSSTCWNQDSSRLQICWNNPYRTRTTPIHQEDEEDLKDFEDKPIFLPRYVKTVGFRLSDDEKILCNELSRYVKEQYNKALVRDKRRNVAFALGHSPEESSIKHICNTEIAGAKEEASGRPPERALSDADPEK